MEEEKTMYPLPLWEPETTPAFSTGMQYHAPFISTYVQQRSDLGECIICTRPPHFVAKVRAFKTHADYKEGKDGYNQKQLDVAQKNENLRQEWIDIRQQANALAIDAENQDVSIKDLQQQRNVAYDDEFDEPRVVAKVPGMNVYLELYGCLDEVEEIDWDGPFGALKTLERMSTWAQNIWNRHDRRPRASRRSEMQPIAVWAEDYDETLRPFMPRKCGIGVWPDIDESRRPDLLFTKTPQFAGADIEGIRILKAEHARLASMGKRFPSKE